MLSVHVVVSLWNQHTKFYFLRNLGKYYSSTDSSVGWIVKTCIHQLCADTGYRLEDLQRAMANRDIYQERIKVKTFCEWYFLIVNNFCYFLRLFSFFFFKTVITGRQYMFPPVLLKDWKWMMEARISISFNNALMAAWMKEPLCCKSQEEENSVRLLRRNTVAERQSRNRIAVVKAEV